MNATHTLLLSIVLVLAAIWAGCTIGAVLGRKPGTSKTPTYRTASEAQMQRDLQRIERQTKPARRNSAHEIAALARSIAQLPPDLKHPRARAGQPLPAVPTYPKAGNVRRVDFAGQAKPRTFVQRVRTEAIQAALADMDTQRTTPNPYQPGRQAHAIWQENYDRVSGDHRAIDAQIGRDFAAMENTPQP